MHIRTLTRYLILLTLWFAGVHFVTIRHPFHWLAGVWEMKIAVGESRFEIWNEIDDHRLVGQGMKVSGKDSMLLETIELVQKEGHYWYIPTVPDQNNALPVSFCLVKSEEMKLTFENPRHDFPQRIIYHIKPKVDSSSHFPARGDTLFVRVESMAGDGMDFRFIRR